MFLTKLSPPQRKMVLWILVADRNEARIYIRRLHMPVSHGPVMRISQESSLRLAANYLNTARIKHMFHRLVIVAPEIVLETLHKHLNKTVKLSIIAEVVQDKPYRTKGKISQHLGGVV